MIDATLTPEDQIWCLAAVAAAKNYSDEGQATTSTATKASRLHFSDLQ